MVFDIIVLIVIFASALIAFLRGVIREVLTILGVVGGMAAAYYAGPLLTPHMDAWLGVKEGVEPEKLLGILPYDILAEILAYGAIFIVVVIVLSIVSHLMAETARAIGLGPIDRTLGVIFGIARGILLMAILYMPFQVGASDDQKKEWFEGSKTHFYIEQVSKKLIELVPDSTMDKLKDDAQTIKDGSATRDKLQQMDLLKKDNAPSDNTAPAGKGPGYTEEFREKMDQLFENKPGSNPPSSPAPAPVQPAPVQEQGQ